MNRVSTITIIVVALVTGAVGYLIAGKPSAPPAMENNTSTVMNNDASGGDRTSSDWKMQNAMSAAPASISAKATVLDYPTEEGRDFVTLRKGENGWTCLPDDPGSPGNDPFCGDAQAMKWFGAYMSKAKPNISQAGLAYMLQGGSDASNTDPFVKAPAAGEGWMSAPPHIMIFPTTPPDPKIYGTDSDAGGPWVMWANTPYAHLMMPVK